MPAPPDCPSLDSWQSLLDVNLPPEQRQHFESHLETCPICQQRLDQAVECGEGFRGQGRRVGDPTLAAADPTLLQVIDRLRQEKPQTRTTSDEPIELYFLTPSPRPDLLGLLGDYEVQEVIGQGGMGVVLKASEPALHRLVAIKVLSPALAGSVNARRRFTREAQAAAAVCHDHIVTVHGVHEVAGLPYLVMQYVAGESLQERLDRTGPLEAVEIVRIGLQTASGLAAAHSQGLIHRDIKPANLLLEDGLAKVKITDFGLARMVDDVGLTQAGVVAGTPEYMAPEQATGEHIDHRADLFSLGSVLYALCTGQPPFRGSTTAGVLHKVSAAAAKPVRELNPDVPAWLEELIARLLAKEPEQRIQTAAEVQALLEGYLAHLRQAGVSAPVLPPPPLPSAEGDSIMLSLACPECAKGLKVKPELAGKKVKCPQCGEAVRVPKLQAPASNRAGLMVWIVAGCAVLGLVLLLVSVKLFSVARRAGRSFLDVPLGYKAVDGVEEQGFYHDEQNEEGPFRWTDGKARLVIPLDTRERPQALFVKVRRPKTVSFQIHVNDRQVVGEPPFSGEDPWWERTLDLSGIELGNRVVVELTSSTVVPKVVTQGQNDDERALGVRVFAITLLSQGQEKPPPSFLNYPVGNRSLVGLEDSGFHKDEKNGAGPFRWTDGRGRLVIPLDPKVRPREMLVQLFRPKNTWLRIKVNGRERVNEKTVDTDVHWWEQTVDLNAAELGESLVVEIESNPIAIPNDSRQLGVRVRAITLLGGNGGEKTSQLAHSFLDVPLGSRFVPGVKEAGFLEQESLGGQPCRWTKGSAQITVPLGDKKPRALAVSAYVPGVPGYRVRVTVNGKTLFDGVVKANSVWSAELPLAGVDLGDSICIELGGSSFVPAQVDPKIKDTRKLGIRLMRMVLLSDAAGEKR